MISISNSLSELERYHQDRAVVLDCYIAAIKNLAQYTIDLSPEITDRHRTHLGALATELSSGTREALEDSRATLRGLLREYRDRAVQYLSGLRDELSARAKALEEIMSCLAQADGDHETRLRAALHTLRSIPPGGGDPSPVIRAAVDAIEQSVDQMRKQYQFTESQFQMEIRMLHKRIDVLESSAALDSLTQLYNRQDMEQRIREARPRYCLLLVKVTGFRRAEVQFRPEVATELAAAFSKRLKNTLPPDTVIGRWSREEFIAILQLRKPEVMAIAKRIGEQLGGAYSCLLNGKAVRATIALSVAVVEATEETAPNVLNHVAAFLNGA